MRARIRTWLLVAIGVLYLMSVPWYRADDSPVAYIWGLPDWVAVALGCYVGVAVLNSLAWLLAEIPDEISERGQGTPRPDDGGRQASAGKLP